MHRFVKRLRLGRARLARSERGNVALLTALVALPFITICAVTVDANTLSNTHYRVESSLDHAVIAVASDLSNGVITEDAIDAQLNLLLEANLAPLLRVESFVGDATVNGDTVSATVTGKYLTVFGGFVNRETIDFQLEAAATVATASAEIVLVLDTSQSMAGERITTLKASANDMVADLVDDGNNFSRMAIVPFNQHVNVGVANRDAWWMNVRDDYTVEDISCSSSSAQYRDAGCVRRSRSCDKDGVASTCNYWDCPAGATVEKTCVDRSRQFRFHGCVDSRPHPYRTNADDFVNHPVRGQLGTGSGNCAKPMMGLTSNVSSLNSTINSLSASSNTYMPAGLVWGLRMLTPGEPFAGAADFSTYASQNGRKAIVLMSDGENTRSPGNKHDRNDIDRSHNQSDRAYADEITLEVCTEIKSKGIELYAIAFDVDEDTQELLEDCATSVSHYHEADNTIELSRAFEEIGGAFREVRLVTNYTPTAVAGDSFEASSGSDGNGNSGNDGNGCQSNLDGDGNCGHGNNPDGVDPDNPGNGSGNNGNGNGNSGNNGNGNGNGNGKG